MVSDFFLREKQKRCAIWGNMFSSDRCHPSPEGVKYRNSSSRYTWTWYMRTSRCWSHPPKHINNLKLTRLFFYLFNCFYFISLSFIPAMSRCVASTALYWRILHCFFLLIFTHNLFPFFFFSQQTFNSWKAWECLPGSQPFLELPPDLTSFELFPPFLSPTPPVIIFPAWTFLIYLPF